MSFIPRFEALAHHAAQHVHGAALTLRDVVIGSALTGGVSLPALPRRARGRRLSDILRHKTVLVTGASSGIGHAVALQVGKAGGTVVLVARSSLSLYELAAEIEAHGGNARVYTADLSSPKSADALIARLDADRVRIDVLVNNAGRSIRRPVDHSYDRAHDFERTMALNYFGSLRLILALLPGMRNRQCGHVINVSSAGVQLGTPLFSAYVASKSALDAFTRVAAGESRHDGVHFTTVNMPLVRTPMIAPTEEFRNLPALTPEEAADFVLRALVTEERQLGTRLGRLISAAHVLFPGFLERIVNYGHRLQTEEARHDASEEPEPGAAPLARSA